MPCLQFKPALDSIKAKHLENKELQQLQVPKELEGKINMILASVSIESTLKLSMPYLVAWKN